MHRGCFKGLLGVVICLTLAVFLCSCANKYIPCTQIVLSTNNTELAIGETQLLSYTLFPSNASDYGFEWKSADSLVASVDDSGKITGISTGQTTISVADSRGLLATCSVTVRQPQIVLSTNNTNITVDDSFSLSYTIIPETASADGLEWQSANSKVASVNNQGQVTAVSPGQTTISVTRSSEVLATCSVTVEQKAAYDRLSEDEKAFVDMFIKNISVFKNPDSVKIISIEGLLLSYKFKCTGQNGFGGNTVTAFYMDRTDGIWNWESMYGSLGRDMDVSVNPDDRYNIDLINDAIAEKR